MKLSLRAPSGTTLTSVVVGSTAGAQAFATQVIARTHGAAHGDDPMKASEHTAAFNLVPYASVTHVAVADGAWSSPSTWWDVVNGVNAVPGAGAKFIIPAEITVTKADTSTVSLLTGLVDGALIFDPSVNTFMEIDTLVISGTGLLQIGEDGAAIQAGKTAKISIAANGPINVSTDPQKLGRGIISHGALRICGQYYKPFAQVAIGEDPMATETTLVFSQDVQLLGWKVGDKVVIPGSVAPYNVHNDGAWIAQSEERTITAIQSLGTVVVLDAPLTYDHPSAGAGTAYADSTLRVHITNITRNVIIETKNGETVPIQERGHVMAMHSGDVDVRYCDFHHLGRTDKSVPARRTSDPDYQAAPTSGFNIQGRYGFHLHRPSGLDIVFKGNVLSGSKTRLQPGWAFVLHDGHALAEDNACAWVFGVGFIGEIGTETGLLKNNITVAANGVDAIDKEGITDPAWPGTYKFDPYRFDLARTGVAIWFQGRLLGAEGNVSANCSRGFVYIHRGSPVEYYLDGNPNDFFITPVMVARADGIPPSIFYNGNTISYGLPTIQIRYDVPPVRHFKNNIAYAAKYGALFVRSAMNQGHDARVHIEGLTAWEVIQGCYQEYVSDYINTDLHLVGAKLWASHPDSQGITWGKNTAGMTAVRPKIRGFNRGIQIHYELPTLQDTDAIADTDWRPALYAKNIANCTTAVFHHDPYHGDGVAPPNFVDSPTVPAQGTVSIDLDWSSVPVLQNNGNHNVSLTGTKTDTYGTYAINDTHETPTMHSVDVAAYADVHGYYAHGTNYYVKLPLPFTDRVYGNIVDIEVPLQLWSGWSPSGKTLLGTLSGPPAIP